MRSRLNVLCNCKSQSYCDVQNSSYFLTALKRHISIKSLQRQDSKILYSLYAHSLMQSKIGKCEVKTYTFSYKQNLFIGK